MQSVKIFCFSLRAIVCGAFVWLRILNDSWHQKEAESVGYYSSYYRSAATLVLQIRKFRILPMGINDTAWKRLLKRTGY